MAEPGSVPEYPEGDASPDAGISNEDMLNSNHEIDLELERQEDHARAFADFARKCLNVSLGEMDQIIEHVTFQMVRSSE